MTSVPAWRVERRALGKSGRPHWVHTMSVPTDRAPTAEAATETYRRIVPAAATDELRARPTTIQRVT